MARLRPPLGAWSIAIALVAIGCASDPDRMAAGADEAPAAPTVEETAEPSMSEATEADRSEDGSVPVPPQDLLATMAATDAAAFEPDGVADGLPNGIEPERIVVPAIEVDADVIDLGLQDDGTMEVPTDFSQTGWFKHGPRPGRVGPALIAGHVDDRSGPAVFFRLAELTPGDRIEVHSTSGDVVTFEVRELEQHAKDAFPTERVYAGTPGSELRLVTCGGVFDRGERRYRDNIIVYAERVDV